MRKMALAFTKVTKAPVAGLNAGGIKGAPSVGRLSKPLPSVAGQKVRALKAKMMGALT